jgi:hypothetical protein
MTFERAGFPARFFRAVPHGYIEMVFACAYGF